VQSANRVPSAGKAAAPAGNGLAGADAAIRANRGPFGQLVERARSLLESETVLGYLLMVPAVALIILFIAYPFVLGVWLAFTDKLVGKEANFIGIENFIAIAQSQIFRQTVWNTVFFTASATVFKSILGMVLALLLNRKFALSRVTRATILLPFIVPTVLSSLAWLWMFDATFSVFNWVGRFFWQMDISVLGLTLKPNLGYFKGINWLGDPGWAMTSIIIANVWRGVPFFAISFLAGLQTVPTELYDAGDIDGANGWQKFWRITLPLIKPIAVVVVVFSIVVTFADFQLVYVLTRGGPHNSTHLFATYAYQLSMASGNLGQGAAVALFMFPFLAVLIIGQLWYLRKAESA
jgi:multiple sugar transport system permease protein